ncbi:MAG: hypothetical protein M3P18_25045 [Actinomycetota bacterium]|nr:hypothetical protein [Actinomycetota bacterium]
MLRKCLAAVVGSLLRLSARRAGIALVYHGVALRTGDTNLELVAPHGVDIFEAEMRHLARTYRVVSAAELLDAVARRRRGERFPIAVTFDDDLASHVSLALRSCGGRESTERSSSRGPHCTARSRSGGNGCNLLPPTSGA